MDFLIIVAVFGSVVYFAKFLFFPKVADAEPFNGYEVPLSGQEDAIKDLWEDTLGNRTDPTNSASPFYNSDS